MLLFALTFTLFLLATLGIYKMFENYAGRKTAQKIANVERLMNYNQEAFRQLAIAQVPVKVTRTQNNGVMNPRSFALVVENAEPAEMRYADGHHNGMIFFSSTSTEEMIQEIQEQIEKLSQKAKTGAK